jgi:hypothetical protein
MFLLWVLNNFVALYLLCMFMILLIMSFYMAYVFTIVNKDNV